jgi:Ni2+-binding GTPase involved in maturation of urease and hydrogenase
MIRIIGSQTGARTHHQLQEAISVNFSNFKAINTTQTRHDILMILSVGASL